MHKFYIHFDPKWVPENIQLHCIRSLAEDHWQSVGRQHPLVLWLAWICWPRFQITGSRGYLPISCAKSRPWLSVVTSRIFLECFLLWFFCLYPPPRYNSRVSGHATEQPEWDGYLHSDQPRTKTNLSNISQSSSISVIGMPLRWEAAYTSIFCIFWGVNNQTSNL